MASLHSASLHRRLEVLTAAVRRRVQQREAMREKATACAAILAALAGAHIDPAQNSGIRYFASAERETARWPDTPELQRADAAFVAQDPQLASRQSLAAEAAQRAGRFAGRPLPDPRSMSPLDWYAWSLAARSGPASEP
jgi:hypothetical protein